MPGKRLPDRRPTSIPECVTAAARPEIRKPVAETVVTAARVPAAVAPVLAAMAVRVAPLVQAAEPARAAALAPVVLEVAPVVVVLAVEAADDNDNLDRAIG